MSHAIRRVPLDFAWPQGTVWEGYRLPERLREAPCPAGIECVDGTTPSRGWIATIAGLLLTLDEDLHLQHGGYPMDPYLRSVSAPRSSQQTDRHRLRPGPDIEEFAQGLVGRKAGVFGHHAAERSQATDKVIAAAGLDPEKWGLCRSCGGTGTVERYPGQRVEAEAWKPRDPPEGTGWQLWETMSEGSPVSPVHPSRQDFVEWLTMHYRPTGMQGPMTEAQAAAFVEAAWASTVVITARRGVQAGEVAVLDLVEDGHLRERNESSNTPPRRRRNDL